MNRLLASALFVTLAIPAAAATPAVAGGSPAVVTLPANDHPVVALALSFHAGAVDDPPGKAGLTYLTARVMAEGGTKALDAKACTVTLDNSTVYHFDAKCDFSKLKVGEKVAITWEAKNNQDWASKVVAAS